MTNTQIKLGASLTVNVEYCDVNDYMAVTTADGKIEYFNGFVNDMTGAFSIEAAALRAFNADHKRAQLLSLARNALANNKTFTFVDCWG